MKILVTGGSGFIGSHLVDVLLEQNHEVVIYDIDDPRFGQSCKYIKGDVNDMECMLAATKGFDVIYHLAAEANVNRFYDAPLHSNLITSTSTLSVLETARTNNISRVILASTEWIYGTAEFVRLADLNTTVPITEETRMLKSLTIYIHPQNCSRAVLQKLQNTLRCKL